MELYLIGGMIKEFRIRRRLTQEDLADVCSVATISRIENGTQVPSHRLVEALFQKMGFSARSNDVPATTTELKRHNLECQMSNIVSNGHYEIKELLAEYKNCAKTMNEFEEQAYLFYSAVYDTEHGISHEKILETYNKALNLTFADYWTVQKNKERDILLTQNELLIIANIAIEKYALGLHDEAISIMEDLKSYYEKKFSTKLKKKNILQLFFFLLHFGMTIKTKLKKRCKYVNRAFCVAQKQLYQLSL